MRFAYYLLSDSAQGAAMEAELTGVPPGGNGYACDVRKGFVYERVPHITLKVDCPEPGHQGGDDPG